MATNIKQGVILAERAGDTYTVRARFDTTQDAIKALRSGDYEGTFDILVVNREGVGVGVKTKPQVTLDMGTARVARTRKPTEAPAPTAGATEVPATEPPPRRGGGLFGRGSA